MVAISLYRGNLHRVPSDVPRRWLMPTPQISLKNFRNLLLRRAAALSLLPSSSSSPPPPPPLKPPENPNSCPEPSNANAIVAVEVKVEDGGDPQPLDQPVSLVNGADDKEKEIAALVDNQIPALEGKDKLDAIDEKQKRKTEVEEKLQILNEKKHNLVQALKQILNAEEELKRRTNVQANRPPLPLQVDVSNDSGSMTRHATPRTGSEANVAVDMEVGDGDDALTHNPQSRQLLRMSSTSPSAESALRRPPYFQHTLVHPARTAASPSRFAPSGNQGVTSNLPTVSVTGTNYIASSPSPAASGGTSGFRDARHPSPWN